MHKYTRYALFAAVLVAAPVFADTKIAVLNYQMALLESDAAKKYAVDSEKKFGPQLNKLKGLESSAKDIQDKLNKGGDKMAQAECNCTVDGQVVSSAELMFTVLNDGQD